MEKSHVSQKDIIDQSSEQAVLNTSEKLNQATASDIVETDALLSLVEDQIKATEIRTHVRKRSRYDIFKSKNENSSVSSQPPKNTTLHSEVPIDDILTLFKSVENSEVNCKVQKIMKPAASLPETEATTSKAEINTVTGSADDNEIHLDMVIKIPSSLCLNDTEDTEAPKEIKQKQHEDVKISEKLSSVLETLFLKLKSENDVNIRCQGILDLALLYYSEESGKIQPSECFRAIQLLSDSHKNNSLAFCHSILLCTLTKQSMTWYEMQFLEDSILTFIHLMPRSPENSFADFSVSQLFDKQQEVAQRLSEKMFHKSNINCLCVDITAILCTSLFNLSTFVKQFCGNTEEYIYKEKTLKYIFEKTCCTTQKLTSGKHVGDDNKAQVSVRAYTIDQCLHIMEHALSINPEKHSSYFHHETFSLHHCLTRLLGWCISIVFSDKNMAVIEQESSQQKSLDFHHSSLVSLLKIFSILTFNPNEYDTFTNVGGLMEKIMICILKAYFSSAENLFDVLVLCLELMINLFIKNQKTFVVLCLKKFKIGNCEEVLAIEALLKMLSETLKRIKEVKSVDIPNQQQILASANPGDNTNFDLQMVLQAAGKDMELSTIAAFTCILITFFIKTKEDFKDYVRQKLPSDVTQDAVDVSKKFFEFATLTGGMPETGLLLLKYAVSKLQSLH